MKDLKPTDKNAILAFCHQCMGYYSDGMQDCETPTCPLYRRMPHRKLKPDLTWTQYHPKRKGLVLLQEIDTSAREGVNPFKKKNTE